MDIKQSTSFEIYLTENDSISFETATEIRKIN